MYRLIACCLLLVASVAHAQSVTLPESVKTVAGRLASIKIEYDGTDVRWHVPPTLDVFREYDPDPKVIRLRIIGYEDGQHTIIAVAAGKNGKLSPFAACVVEIGKPKPPTPPEPGPPPDPKPVPDEKAPIPVVGYRIMVVYETLDTGKLTKGQMAALLGEATRDWMLSKAAKVNGQPEIRYFDPDQKMGGESQLWKDAFARPRQSLPWLLVSNGKTGYEGPLPKELPDILAILQKHAKENP